MKNTVRVNGKEIEYTRAVNDVNGNPRYIFHFLDLLTDEQSKIIGIDVKYNIALNNSRMIGGKKYRGKDFGGGIVISSYSLEADLDFMFGFYA